MRFLLKPKIYGLNKFLYETKIRTSYGRQYKVSPPVSHSNLIFKDENAVVNFVNKCYSEDIVNSHIHERLENWHFLVKMEGMSFKDSIKNNFSLHKDHSWSIQQTQSYLNNYHLFILNEVEIEGGTSASIQEKITWTHFLKLCKVSGITNDKLVFRNIL